jgi:hypothetical protein
VSLQGALYEYWVAQSGITDLVGTRIYPTIAPTSATRPYAVYQIISEAREPHMAAASELVSKRVQVTCYGSTPDSAEAVAEAFRAEMDGYSGDTMGSGDNATAVRRVLLDGAGEGADPPNIGDQQAIYWKRQDYIVWHHETVPTF